MTATAMFGEAISWVLDVGFFQEDPARSARERFPELTEAELGQIVEIAEARFALEMADIERGEREKA